MGRAVGGHVDFGGGLVDGLHRWVDVGCRVDRGVDPLFGGFETAAFEAGINNRVTANGMVRLFRAIHESWGVTPLATSDMLEILFRQQFRSGIPAGLPSEAREKARIAHKTGEISTVAHDAGVVFPPDRKPFVLVVLTEWDPEGGKRMNLIARTSRAVYDHFVPGSQDA